MKCTMIWKQKKEKESVSNDSHHQTVKPKSWSEIVSEYPATIGPVKKKTTRIKPVFNSDNTGYDRIVITPTHFNNKPFVGFVTEEEAETISKAIGLKELGNHHGTSFYRNEKDVLFITFRLKCSMSLQEISKSINKYYWYDKESRAGNLDKVSGQVVHPPMEDDTTKHEEESFSLISHGVRSGNLDDTKELRIDGCNYEISEHELQNWIELYGEMKSEIEEIALPSEKEEEPVGTGSYAVKVKLKRSIPNILPIGGLKVKFTYSSVKKQCKNCYGYHTSAKKEKETNKTSYLCEKKTYEQYVTIFAENNPRIMQSIADYKNNQDEFYKIEEMNKDYTEELEDNNDDNVDYNYNYENSQTVKDLEN